MKLDTHKYTKSRMNEVFIILASYQTRLRRSIICDEVWFFFVLSLGYLAAAAFICQNIIVKEFREELHWWSDEMEPCRLTCCFHTLNSLFGSCLRASLLMRCTTWSEQSPTEKRETDRVFLYIFSLVLLLRIRFRELRIAMARSSKTPKPTESSQLVMFCMCSLEMLSWIECYVEWNVLPFHILFLSVK